MARFAVAFGLLCLVGGGVARLFGRGFRRQEIGDVDGVFFERIGQRGIGVAVTSVAGNGGVTSGDGGFSLRVITLGGGRGFDFRLVVVVVGRCVIISRVGLSFVLVLVFRVEALLLGQFFLEDRLTIRVRDLVVVGVDLREGQEAVAIAGVVDERGLQGRFDPRDLCQIYAAAQQFAGG